jgi:hypothetical protein
MGMTGAEEILTEGVVHVTAALVHQRGEQKITAVLNCGYSDENNPGHHSRIASHGILLGRSLDVASWMRESEKQSLNRRNK